MRALFPMLLVACATDPASLPVDQAAPAGTLRLSPNGIQVAGEPVQYAVNGAQPGAPVYLGASLASAPDALCPPGLAPACIDLAGRVSLLGTVTANASGSARFALDIPPTAPTTTVNLQAASIGPAGVDTSNLFTAPIFANPPPTCVLDFEDAFAATGDASDPDATYGTTVGFDQPEGYGLVGGLAAGDPGGWNHVGPFSDTIPDAAWLVSSPNGERARITFPEPVWGLGVSLARSAEPTWVKWRGLRDGVVQVEGNVLLVGDAIAVGVSWYAHALDELELWTEQRAADATLPALTGTVVAVDDVTFTSNDVACP